MVDHLSVAGVAWRGAVDTLMAAAEIADRPTTENDVRADAQRIIVECLVRLKELQASPATPPEVRAEVENSLRIFLGPRASESRATYPQEHHPSGESLINQSTPRLSVQP